MSLENFKILPESSSTPKVLLSPKLTPLIVTNLISSQEEEQHHSSLSSDNTINSPPPPLQLTDASTTASVKDLQDTSRNSDSGKSSSCSPTLLDCSFDSGIAGVLLENSDMQLLKRIQQCQRILLALEREREHFDSIRSRLR